jgi:hypothetical protein
MTTRAKLWAGRVGGFFFTVLEIVALGALLGAIVFPIVGKLSGAHKTTAELVIFGARTLGFYFFVWAPGIALVREFMRAAKARRFGPPRA